MTVLTVNIQNENDLPVLQEILKRFGLEYAVENEDKYVFSKAEIEILVKRKQDFIDGKTTARDLDEIEKDLDRAYN